MAFPDLRVEIQAGTEWVDITADTFTQRQQVTISRGRADEAARTDPARCQLGLNNRDGRYSPKNPRSPYYGLIGRNTPLRVSVAGSAPQLVLDGSAGGYATTPDAAPLRIVGDLDLRAEVGIDWMASGQQVLIGKWDGASGQRAYSLRVLDQRLIMNWSTDGVSPSTWSAAVPLPTLPDRAAVRATLDADNGVGGWTARFYWARSLAGPWTQIGNPVTGSGTMSIYPGTAPLRVGSPDATTSPPRTPFAGSGYRFEVRAGIDGTVVASPDFTAVAPGSTSFTDGTGHVWTLTGTAEVSNRLTRFVGEVSSWPSRWGVSGQDVWVPLEASGITRRLGQGVKPLASTLARRIPSEPALLAYWPMEEERDASQAYSPLPGVQPMVVSGVEFASDDTLAGSSALPKISTTSSLGAQVPPGPNGVWRVECVYKLSDYPATAATILEVRTAGGTYDRLQVEVRPSNVRVYGIIGTGSPTVILSIVPAALFTGAWNRLHLRAETSGGATTFHCNWITIGVQERGLSITVPGVTAGHVTSVQCAPGAGIDQRDLSMGHLSVMSVVQSTIYNLADEGFSGDTAWSRMRRLSQEETVPLVISGTATDTPAMGPQRPNTLLDLLGQAADTDGGILGETRDRLALRYRVRTSLYSQPAALALDYQGPGLAPPLDPEDDDADVRNDITVQRIGGSAARAVLDEGPLSVQPPPAGVGLYDESVPLSLDNDAQAEPIAWWRLWMGTQDELRYPTVHVDLASAPQLVDAAAAVVEGDRITIDHPPAWLPPEMIDLIAQGYTETFQPYKWDIVYTCTPARPWNVAIAAEDSLTGIVYLADTDGSQLSTPVDAAATTLLVAVTAGPLWPTGGADLPVDVMLGGERMTVTAVSGASSPQTFTVVRSINGIAKSHTAGTAVSLAAPAIAAL